MHGGGKRIVMPKRLLPGVDDAIIRCYFKGYSRDETVEECGSSAGTVSGAWQMLEHKIGPEGRALRELAQKLRLLDLTVADADKGAVVASLHQKLGVDLDSAESFLKRFIEEAVRKGMSPEPAAGAALRLLETENKSGLTYEKILSNAEEKAAELVKTKEQLEILGRQVHEQEVKYETLLEQNNITEQDLKAYKKAEEALKPHNLSFEDHERLVNVMSSVREQGYNPEKIINELARQISLDAVGEKMRLEMDSNQKKLSELQRLTKTLAEAVEQQKDRIAQANELKKIGIESTDLTYIRNKVAEIGAKAALPPREALEKFIQDVEVQYDAKVGFEAELTRLQNALKIATLALEVAKAELQTTTEKTQSRRKAIEAIEHLRRLGIMHDEVAAWHDIYQKAGKSVEQFAEELEKYSGLEGLLNAKSERLSQFDGEIAEREARLKELNARLPEVKAAVKTIEKEAADAIGKASEQVTGQMRVVQQKINEADSAWESFLAELKGLPEKLKPYEEQMSKAMSVGEQIGKYELVAPIYKIISKSEVPPEELLPTMVEVLKKFVSWAKTHLTNPTPLVEAALNLVSALSDEMH